MIAFLKNHVKLFACLYFGLLALNANAQSITVTSPNGGETLNVFSKKSITWTTSGLSKGTTLQILYSVDNGVKWNLIGENTYEALNGVLNWHAPDSISANCKIRVKAKSGSPVDDSDAAFAIAYSSKQIVLHYPNGGETLANGTQTITWGAGSGVANVNIYIPGTKGAKYPLATNVQNTGSYTFTFANATQLTNNVVVIEEAENTANKDQSNFEVNTSYGYVLNSINVNCCKFFQVGSERDLSFYSRYIYKVNYYYSTDGGYVWKTIVLNHPNDVPYLWKIPVDESNNVKLKVENATNTSQFLESSYSVITSIPASITLSYPNGGESLSAGAQVNIVWANTSTNGGYLEYSTNNGSSWTMISGSPQASPYLWTVPATVASTYKIRVKDFFDYTFTNVMDESEATFSVVAATPAVTITSPNGGESFQGGSAQDIKWTSSVVSQVNLEYSTDNGSSWTNIATGLTASLGTYSWNTPSTASTDYLIRISDSADPNVKDVSNAVFAVKTLALTSPNGGESWDGGTTQNITWASSGVSSVFLHYTIDNGVTWTQIGSTMPATPATYAWTVPALGSTNFKVRISDRNNDKILDVSDAAFTVTTISPSITVTSPNGGQSFVGGTSQTISWTTLNIPSTTYLYLEYSTDNETWNNIASVQVSAGTSKSWTVPSNVGSSNCYIRVKTSDLTASDVSDAPFSITSTTPYTLGLTSLNNGEVLNNQATYDITFSTTLPTTNSLYFYYSLDNGITWIYIGNNKISLLGGKYTWSIPNNIASTQAKVKVESITPFRDISNAPFTISTSTPGSLAIVSPNGGESWPAGSYQSITWTSTNISDANVELFYSTNNGSTWTMASDGVPNNGTYTWLVPDILSSVVKFRVATPSPGIFKDESNSNFSIVAGTPTVTLGYPNGTENLVSGSSTNISWTSFNISKVNLEYTTDGVNWSSIANNVTASAGYYSWVLPNENSTNVKVRVSDASQSGVNDLSNAAFTIKPPFITILSPAGGEIWNRSSVRSISWLHNQFGSFNIDYSTDGGTNWSVIVANTYASPYSWTVPVGAIVSDNYKIRISRSALSSTSNVFSVKPYNYVIVNTPNGGEALTGGATKAITWSSVNITNVKIDYSIDGGTNWTTIVTPTAASAGTYNWTVPSINAVNALIRISDYSDATAFDVSNAAFSITAPKLISLTSPNTAATYTSGTVQNITWTSSAISNVKLEYSTDGGITFPNTIAANLSATPATFAWTIPQITSSTVKVRVSDASDITTNDVSDVSFTIQLPPAAVALTSPNGGEIFIEGNSTIINWTSTSVAQVALRYSSNNGSSWTNIATVTASLGTYSWTIPTGNPIAAYLVEVSDASNASLKDQSNAVFTVNGANSITLGSLNTSNQISTPFSRDYAYAVSEFVVTQAEINQTGFITKLGFYKSSGTNLVAHDNVAIYLKDTTSTTLNSGGFSFVGYTKVYEGPFPNNATTGWMEVAFQKGFEYKNTKSLAIMVVRDFNTTMVTPVAPYYTYTSSGANYKFRSGTSATNNVSYLANTQNKPDLRIQIAPKVANDAGVVALASPVVPFNQGTNAVNVAIKNYGTSTLTSAKIDWKANGVAQTTYNWTGSLAPGATSANINIGNYSFINSNNLVFSTSQPNGASEPNAFNDTLKITNLLPRLSGALTIGGSNPNFKTFTEAIQGISTYEVGGAITFNVRPGTYTEQIVLPQFNGVSAANTITFQSESGDSTSVTLSAVNTYPTPIVQFNGADYVTFKKLTIQANGGSNNSKVVEFVNGANQNQLLNNRLIGSSNPYSFITECVVLSENTNTIADTANVIRNNAIMGGSYGVYFNGPTSHKYEGNNWVENNVFTNQYVGAVYSNNQKSFRVNGNMATTTSNAGSYRAFSFQGVQNNLQITGNKVYDTYEGIYFSSTTAGAGSEQLIANNFVRIKAGSPGAGITTSGGSYFKIYYNTLVAGSSGVLSLSSTSNIDVKNNIVYNNNGGRAVFVGGLTNWTSNNNAYYTSGVSLGYFNAELANLAAWKTATSQDANSIFANVLFKGASDLHVHPSFSPVNSKGLNIASITTDIDGEVRSNPSDIGADEYTPYPNNSGIVQITGPVQPFNGNQSVIVTLKNFGSSALTQANINWSVNGSLQSSYAWTGSVAASDSLKSINIGNYNFTGTSPFIVKVWTSNPNGVTDPDMTNDSTTVTTSPALSGTYTIGGATPNFATIGAAAQALSANGVSGPVVFNIRNGNFLEKIKINPFIGSSTTNTVTFKSETNDSTGVVLHNSGTHSGDTENLTLGIFGADNLIFKKITIKRTNADNYTRTVYIRDGAENIEFNGCVLEVSNNNIQYEENCVVQSLGSTVLDKNLKFIGNRIRGGRRGIHLEGGTTPYASNNQEQGLEIRKNVFENQSTGGNNTANIGAAVELRGFDSPIIDGNNLGSRGIFFKGIRNKFIVTNNRGADIGGMFSYWNGFYYTTKGAAGLSMEECYGSAGNNSLVANNAFPLLESGGSGIYSDNSSYIDIVYNSINTATTGSFNGIYIFPSCSNITVQNNNVANNGTSGSVVFASSATNCTFSYNNYYSSSGRFLKDGANTIESNSLNVKPLYVSSNDLHVGNNLLLSDKGSPFAGITYDLGGVLRNATTPDIGAYEFTLLPADAGAVTFNGPLGIINTGVQNVATRIVNFGSSPLTSTQINWSVNNAMQTPFAWTGSLNWQDSSSVINIGTFDFQPGINYAIKIWTKLPNGNVDPVFSNDTVKVSNKWAALNGTYTLGGTNPTFTSFAHAMTSMQNGTIAGPVTFNVRNGTYTEQLVFTTIPGSSSVNTVTFQSESNDSSLVSLEYAATAALSNYVIKLNGFDYLTFKKMTINAKGTTYARVVEFTGGAMKNSFIGNVIKGKVTTSSFSDFALIYSGSSPADTANVFKGNRFVDGSAAISFDAQGATPYYKNTLVEDNAFINQYDKGLNLFYLESWTIKGNSFSTNTTNSNYNGILLQYGTGNHKVLNNKIIGISRGIGIASFSSNGSTGKETVIANNFIVPAGSSDAGISLSSANYINIYNNNIHVLSTYSGATAMKVSAGNMVNIANNNFINKSTGYAFYLSSNPTAWTSNYNNLFTNGTNLAYSSSNNRVNLAAWKTATAKDANSISVDPQFISDNDLHINRNSSFLNGTGQTVAGVATDIDGEIRNNPPDIGADEYSPYGNNASAVQVTSPGVPMNSGTNPILVTIKNSGLNNLTSAKIHFAINGGAVTDYNWTGNVVPNDSAKAINIGSANFAGAGIANNIKVWTTDPNGAVDPYAANDTVNVTRYASLAGTYTIGATGADFPSFTAAVTTLNVGGVSGPVVFNVKEGTYTESITLNQVLGASATNRITFQSESGDSTKAILTQPASINANVIKMNGADFITFRKMTIQKTTDSGWFYAVVIDMGAGANNNIFSNNVLKTINNVSLPTYHVLVMADQSGTSLDTANVFLNNNMQGGNYGIYDGGFNSPKETGTIIKNNIFSNQTDNAMYVAYQKNLIVDGNAITTNSTNASYYAVSLNNCVEGTKIRKNRISGAVAGRGVYLNTCSGLSGNEVLVANNFIQVGGTVANTVGIYAQSSNYVKYYHNSVLINSTNATAYAFYDASGNNLNIRNNIFANTGTGLAIYFASVPTVLTCDYNDLYTAGTNLGYWNSTNRTNLAAWKTASGKDANSLSINPNFFNNTNLTPAETAVKEKGTPLTDVTDDINGLIRDVAKPDMGAVELLDNPLDAGVYNIIPPAVPFAAGNQNLSVTVKNYGSATLTSASIKWMVNGIAQTPVAWTGSIATGATSVVSLGTFNFAIDSAYSVTAWPSNINGGSDAVAANDTSKIANIYAGLTGTYTIGATGSTFKSLTRAVNNLNFGGVLGAVTFNIKNGTYTERVSINTIAGANAANNITFQSANSDSSLVILTTNYSITDNYIIRLNGAKYVTFKKLTFSKTVQNYSRMVYIENNCKNIQLLNSVFSGPIYSNNSSDRELIYNNPVSNDSSIVISNNKFIGGATAIILWGTSTFSQPGTVIQNNNFTNQYTGGISLKYHTASQVVGNTFATTATTNNFTWITLDNIKGKQIVSKNKLSGTGNFVITTCTSTSGNEALIYNNFIQFGGTTNSAYAIQLTGSTYQNLYYNSVHVTNTGTASAVLSGPSSCSNIKLSNNSFVNAGGGYVYNSNYTLANVTLSNYNNLYQLGTSLSPSYATLAAWKTYSSKEANSIAIAPSYTSASDLHASAILMNNAGTPIAGITDDIDGELRNATTPDIGADEFAPPADNTGVVLISNPKVPFTHGSNNVMVAIKNFGTSPLTNAKINWSVNNVAQPEFSWTGNIASADSAKNINIGAYDFGLKTAYTIKVWTSLPNGNMDSSPGNDTLKISNLYSALNGTYTLGGTSPTFTTFYETTVQLNKGGVTGPVTINVRNGNYVEQPYFTATPGASLNNRITFQSESGDSSAVRLYSVVSDATYNYALVLWGANNFTFRKMTIEAAGTYGKVIICGANSSNHIFENNIIKGKPVSTVNSEYDLVTAYDSSNVFIKNRFVNGNLALNIGLNAGVRGLKVENNIFENQYTSAIYLSQLESPIVKGNLIKTNSAKTDYKAIDVYYGNKNILIANNRIEADADGTGIYFSSSKGTVSELIKVYNNFIQIGKTGLSYGIYLGEASFNNPTSYVDLYYNSINQTSTNVNNGHAIYIKSASSLNSANNIFANTGGGYAVYVDKTPGFASSDYNDFYTKGSNVAYYNGNINKLSTWKTTTSFDLNSKSANPLYVSKTDLHSSQPVIDEVGKYLANYLYDIDGTLRGASHDIGADEFTPIIVKDVKVDSIYKISAVCAFAPNESITIRIKNNGNYPFNVGDQIPVGYSVDLGTVVNETITLAQTLYSQEAIIHTFSTTADLSQGNYHVLKAFTKWSQEEVVGNDTTTNILEPSNKPTASFSYVSQGNKAFKFNPDNQGYTGYSWKFGDGQTSTAVSPTHTYATSGNYTIELIVTDGASCSAKAYSVINLAQETITVTSPNSSVSWQIGSTQNITWNSTGVSKVKIEYTTDNATTWKKIADTTSASVGSYSWVVPNTVSTQALVRISNVFDQTVNDVSNSTFEIGAAPTKSITLTSPNGGENLIQNISKSITWSSSNVDSVKVEYSLDNGSTWTKIVNEKGSAGKYAWTPLAVSTQAKIRISDVANASLSDESETTFNVIAPSTPIVGLTSPNGGENWVVNQTNSINWTSSNVTNVNLEYSIDNGTVWHAITTAQASLGKYSWTPSFTSDFVKVRIVDADNISIKDESNDFFVINPIPTSNVTLSHPSGGENFVVQDTIAIAWTSSNAAEIKLEYSVNQGVSWNLINTVTATPGTYKWITDFTSDAVLVKASDASNGGSFSTSAAFRINPQPTPSITLTAPVGGESWTINKPYSITWTSVKINNVKVEYTLDNGSTWNSITTTPATPGSYSWTPNFATASVIVKVSDASNTSISGQSKSFVINSAPAPVYYQLSGTLTTTDGDKVMDGKVILLKIDSTDLSYKIFSTQVLTQANSINKYTFDKLYASTYMVLVVPNKTVYPNLINTYAPNASQWSNASVVKITSADVTANISVVKLPTQGAGNGSLSGLVAEGTAGTGGIQNGRIEGLGDPLKNVPVMLYNKATGELAALQYTNAAGEFNLTGLAPGTYNLVIDYPGVPMDQTTSVITIGDGTKVELTAVVNKEGVVLTIESITGVEDDINIEVTEIYPNPSSGPLSITFNSKKASIVTFGVTDAVGRAVIPSQLYKSNVGKNRVRLDLTNVSNGIYLLNIITDGVRTIIGKVQIEK